MRAFLVMTTVIIAAIGIGVAIDTAASPTPTNTTNTQTNTWTISPRIPELRLFVNQVCPRNISHYHDVLNDSANAHTSLVSEDPTTGLICRYGAIPSTTDNTPYALVVAKRFGRLQATALASTIDRLSTKRPTEVYHCPAAFAAVTIIALSYASMPDADLWYDDTGCATVDNGCLEASEDANPAFYEAFTPLVDRIAPR